MMNRTPEQWAAVDPDAVVGGSAAQAINVLRMALDDIAVLVADRDRLQRVCDRLRAGVDAPLDRRKS